MKISKYILIASFIFLPVFSCSQEGKISTYDDIGGLNTQNPSHSIPVNDFQDLQDVFTDNKGYIEVRGGLHSVFQTTGAIQNQYEYINMAGNKYRIIKSSANLGYINTTGAYVHLLSTLPVNCQLWKMQYKNECYLGTDFKTDRWLFDPTSASPLVISTYIPCGKYPIVSMDKAFMINISTPMLNKSPISTNGDESIVVYSAIGDLKNWTRWIAVSRDDGESLTGGFVLKGNLYVTKKNSIHTLTGIWNNDTTDGERATPLNTNLGCVSHYTTKELNGKEYWLSASGAVEFDGNSYRIISNDVQDDIEDIGSGTVANTQTNTDTTQTDFGCPSTTSINIDTATSAGSIKMKASNVVLNQSNDSNAIADSGAFPHMGDSDYQTFMTSYTLLLSTISIYGMRSSVLVTEKLTIKLTDSGGTLMSSSAVDSSQISLTTYTWIPVNFSGWNIILTSGTEYYIVLESTNSGTYPNYYNIALNKDRYDRGKHTQIQENYDILFRVYLFHYSVGQYSQYQSAVKDLNTNWIQWDKFKATQSVPTGTSLTWFVSAGNTSASCKNTNLKEITNDLIISTSTGGFIMYFASMSTTDVGLSPQIDDVSISYTASGAEIPLVAYADETNYRYWLSGISPNSTINDIVYVWQGKNEKWTKLKMNARSFCKFNGEFYIGGSTPTYNTDIWRYSTDYTDDNGESINSFVQTPDYITSSRNVDTKFGSLWVYSEPSSIYSNLTVSAYINKGTTAYKTFTVPQSPVDNYNSMFIKNKIVCDLTMDRFRTIAWEFSGFSKLYGFDMNYTAYEEGEK